MLAVNLGGDGTKFPAFTLYVMTLFAMQMSGGHINPAVTLGVAIENGVLKNNVVLVVIKIFAQIAGACCALIISYLLRVTDVNGLLVPGMDTQEYLITFKKETNYG